MSIFAIGDLQGCLTEVEQLLEQIHYDPAQDQLWFTGDIVNRGPQSLECLRFVKSLGDGAVTVLGNHDLNLLAINFLEDKQPHRKDTLDEILVAPDRDELLDWLRHRPLLHQEHGYTLIHAGLAPQWSIKKAARLAAEVEAALQGEDYVEFFANMYGNTPAVWNSKLKGWDRLRCITNYLTRIRYCDKQGRYNLHETGSPGSQKKGLMPWFEVPNRESRKDRLVFGHWSTLRLTAKQREKYLVYPLDSGCLWGGDLTALKLEDESLHTVSADPQRMQQNPALNKYI